MENIRNGDQPADISLLIHNNWRRVWPRVITRAWLHQFSMNEKDGEVNEADQVWYNDLLSWDPIRVRKSLDIEGLISLAGMNAEQENWRQWVYSDFFVRVESDEKQELTIPAIPESAKYHKKSDQNGWGPAVAFRHHVVLSIPPRPTEKKECSVKITEYSGSGRVYVFSC